MVALSEDEALLSKLFQYRFSDGRGLQGSQLRQPVPDRADEPHRRFCQSGATSRPKCSRAAAAFIPSTAANVVLEAELENGVHCQRRDAHQQEPARASGECVWCRGVQAARRNACAPSSEADLITFGPGSLFTSVIPNVLVHGIPRAIQRSRALKAYFVNLMWQPGETIGFTRLGPRSGHPSNTPVASCSKS